MQAWSLHEVVDSLSDPKTEIPLEKARLINSDIQLGDTFEKEMDPAYLGRIAAQTARQAIMQRLRQFEKERIYDDFKDQVGDIVSGIVRRRERGDLCIDLGKAEAIMPVREQVPGKTTLLESESVASWSRSKPRAEDLNSFLSRSSPKFVRRLFDLEVTEIADGTVTIEAFARDGVPYQDRGFFLDPKVDPSHAA